MDKYLRPNIQLFAGQKDDPELPAGQENQNQTDKKPEENGDLPKTQEELDALIEKRFARERKKIAKQAQQPSAPVAQPAAQPAAQSAQQPAAAPQPAAVPQEKQELESARRELLTARAQIEAFRSGVRADLTEDAVALAMMELEKNGDDPDEESVQDALKAVLKRHPDWKSDTQKKTGGIKVGAQQQETSGGEPGKPAYSGTTFF